MVMNHGDDPPYHPTITSTAVPAVRQAVARDHRGNSQLDQGVEGRRPRILGAGALRTLSWEGPRLRSSGAHWAGLVPGWGPAVHTELGSWQRAWRRVGKAEVEVEVDADMVEEKLEEEAEEEEKAEDEEEEDS